MLYHLGNHLPGHVALKLGRIAVILICCIFPFMLLSGTPSETEKQTGDNAASEKWQRMIAIDPYNPQTYPLNNQDYPKLVSPPDIPFFLFENFLDMSIPVGVVNVFETPVNYKKLDIPDLKNLFESGNLNLKKIDKKSCNQYLWQLPLKKNFKYVLGFDLNNIQSTDPGFYFLKIEPPILDKSTYDRYSYYNGSLFQLTDVALIAKYSQEQIFLVSFNLETGLLQPAQTFKIENFNPKCEPDQSSLGQVISNNEGIAIFQPPAAVLEKNKLEDCFVFSQPYLGFVWGKKEPMCQKGYYHTYDVLEKFSSIHLLAFTEKYLYKEGQTVQFKGMIRQIAQSTMSIPKIVKVEAKVIDSRGEIIKSLELPEERVTPFGSFAGEFTLPQNIPTGIYRIEFSLYLEKGLLNKSIDFSVQEYKPSKYEVNISLDQESLVSGKSFSGTLNGCYLFGTPMKQAEGRCIWTIRPIYYVPQGWPGYQFGEDRDDFKENIIFQEKFTLDDMGNYKFKRSALTLPGKETNSALLTVHGEVKDQDNNRLSSKKSIEVHRGEYYIGFKAESNFFNQQEPGRLHVVTVDPRGNPVKNTGLNITISREEWVYVETKDKTNSRHGEWRRKIISVLRESIKLPQGKFEKEFNFNKPGYYIARLQGIDRLKNTITTIGHFYVTGEGYVPWGDSSNYTIALETDKSLYKPGDNIDVLIKSPFKTVTALITVERENVLWWKTFRLEGNARTVRIPVQKEFMPNVFIHVLLLKERTGTQFDSCGNDVGKPKFYSGSKEVRIDAGENRLNVEIIPDKTCYEPGDEVKLNLRVTAQNGAPVKSELCIAVVDKGILNLVNYRLPNPFDFFWSSRPWNVKTVSTFNDILERNELDLNGYNLADDFFNFGIEGGIEGSVEGGVEGGVLGGVLGGVSGEPGKSTVSIRNIFKETVFYQDVKETDENGNVRVSFKLSDDITTFKAMVTAVTTGESFGGGSVDFPVKKNLILKPAAPYFLRPLDVFSAGVTITNTTDNPLNANVRLEYKNVIRQKGDPDEKTITLQAGQSLPVRFGFQVSDTASTAPVQLTFKAMAGKSSDGLLEEIPIRIPRITEAEAIFGRVDDTPQKEQLIVPSQSLRHLDNVEITLSSSAMVGVKRHFAILQEYPYDCLEQRISKQYPLVGAADFLLTYKLLDMSKQDIDQRISELLARMPLYQKTSGGFTYYPESSYPSEYLTCYALEFILDARARGYAVDANMVKRAEGFLKTTVTETKIVSQYSYSSYVENLLKSYAIYVLAKDNILMIDEITKMFSIRDQIPFSGLAYLVKALDIKNDLPAFIQPVLARLMLIKIIDDPTSAHFENPVDNSWCWVHESNIKTTATVLEAFLAVYEKFPYAEKIARWLTIAANKNRSLSTQEHIRLFIAFEKYFHVFENETPDFVSQVLLNGVTKIEEPFNGRELTARTHKIDLGPYPPGNMIETIFTKEGAGMLYYLLRMTYYPLGEVAAKNCGVTVEKIYKTLKGIPVTTNTLKAGEKYIVEVIVTTKSERSFVILDDPVPAGLKVENPYFEVSSRVDLQKATRENNWKGYWGKFYRSEVYFDRVQVFADFLHPGTHVWKYLVIAANEGTYTVPNTVVSEMYNPEVFGRNASRSIHIK